MLAIHTCSNTFESLRFNIQLIFLLIQMSIHQIKTKDTGTLFINILERFVQDTDALELIKHPLPSTGYIVTEESYGFLIFHINNLDILGFSLPRSITKCGVSKYDRM